jgi:biopolymer transport protein ExbB/TolQ
VAAGKIDEAIKVCAASTAALPDMGLVILRSRNRDEVDLQNVANAASLSVLPRLTRRMHYLPTLAVAAALLGFLGTVLGFRAAFASSAANSNAASLDFAHALTPSAFGLGVAVVLILGRAYVVNQSETITEPIREFSARLINALIDRPDVRLGHR